MVPEVALGGDGGVVHARPGVVAGGGVGEGRRHVGGREVVFGAGGRRRPVVLVRGWCQRGPPRRHAGRRRRPGAIGCRLVHVAPPGGGRACGGRRWWRLRRRACYGGLRTLLRHALHER
jgi:hypothetical protein